MRSRDLHYPTLGAVALTVLLLFFGLGSYGLLEDNEARFFEISWEMARSGDWLTPRLNFIDHFHKPPGTFWLVAGSLKLLGESELAGRIPVAVAGLITVILTCIWGTRESGREAGSRAVLVLITSLEFWFLSRLVLTDMFLTAAVTAALFCAWSARRGPATWSWVGFWVSLAASTMFKGPIGLAVVVPVIWIFHLTCPEKRSWNLRPRLGLPLFLALSLPWYVTVCLQHDGLIGYFLKFQTAQRMLTTVHGRPGPWWFYFPALLGGFFPWSTGLLLSLRSAWKRRDEFDRFLLLWIVIPFLFFSCAGSKLPTYLLPIFPALALLTARQEPKALRRLGTVALATLAVFALAVATYLAVGAAPEIQPGASRLTALAAVLGIGTVMAICVRSRFGTDAWFAIPGYTWAAGLLILATALGPCDAAYSARHVAQEVRAKLGSAGEVVEVADHLHGLPYYLDRRVVQVSYPRETQFEPPEDYRDYLYPNLTAYFEARKMGSPILILRRSDYEAYADPSWPHQEIGNWTLPQPPTPGTGL